MSRKQVTRGYGLLENFLARKRAAMANKLIPSRARKGRILDIGCGFVPYFLINTRFKEKHGIDPSIRSSRFKNRISIKIFDIEKNSKLPYDDCFFDTVTMLAVLEHIEKERLISVLQEIRRVLKPSGRIVLTTPAPQSEKLLLLMSKLRIVSPEEIQEHKGTYSQKSIANHLAKAGFRREKIKTGYFELFLNNWAYADK